MPAGSILLASINFLDPIVVVTPNGLIR